MVSISQSTGSIAVGLTPAGVNVAGSTPLSFIIAINGFI